jgi:predicted helicase
VKVFYADLWGLREGKYKYLFENDVRTTNWQELEPFAPYYFFVPKDFALQVEYERFWKVTDIFKEWSSGVKTHRDHFVVGFTKEEIVQRLRVFTGNLPDDLVKQSLNLKDTRDWKLKEGREKVKQEKLENKIYPYAYRAFDNMRICYSFSLIEQGCDRWDLMKHFISSDKGNIVLVTTRQLTSTQFNHSFVTDKVSDMCFISNKGRESNYFFPLYLYPEKPVGAIHELPLQNKSQLQRISNFTPAFLQAIKESSGKELTQEEIFYYIYAILYSPTYRKRYEEFLKIDFPRVPLPSNKEIFEKLSNLGKELVEIHLLKHPSLDKTETGFPISGSNKVEKIVYDEKNRKVFLNKEQYFEEVSKEVWEYRIGAYQVMEKYLKDRKGRKLSLDEINHYMKVAKAIQLTIKLQEMIDDVYRKIEV